MKSWLFVILVVSTAALAGCRSWFIQEIAVADVSFGQVVGVFVRPNVEPADVIAAHTGEPLFEVYRRVFVSQSPGWSNRAQIDEEPSPTFKECIEDESLVRLKPLLEQTVIYEGLSDGILTIRITHAEGRRYPPHDDIVVEIPYTTELRVAGVDFVDVRADSDQFSGTVAAIVEAE